MRLHTTSIDLARQVVVVVVGRLEVGLDLGDPRRERLGLGLSAGVLGPILQHFELLAHVGLARVRLLRPVLQVLARARLELLGPHLPAELRLRRGVALADRVVCGCVREFRVDVRLGLDRGTDEVRVESDWSLARPNTERIEGLFDVAGLVDDGAEQLLETVGASEL